MTANRLITISNRLPVVIEKDGDKWKISHGSGGLVTAMAPVLRDRGGLWIGWSGTTEEDNLDLSGILESGHKTAGYTLKPVTLTLEEKNNFYQGFSNEIIWPLFHDLQSICNFDPVYWSTYLKVNEKFARVILENTGDNDFIWVHDYHLINVAGNLRDMGYDSRIGFFLHIPFPSSDIFSKLPWRIEILTALLKYDLIGFQTLRDRKNFIHCVRTFFKNVHTRGKGQVLELVIGDRKIRIGTFPISIDYDDFSRMATTPSVAESAWYIHEDLPNRTIILGVDRLDYTKGIPLRLKAFRNLLTRYPDLQGNINFIQVVVPSRADIIAYNDLRTEIQQLVSEINGEFTRSGWVPVHYIFRNMSRHELLAYYRTAEIALVTPLKDGMNLVAKEYCACNIENNGVLILSEFAGAMAQLKSGALLVNPYNIEAVADAIHKAINMTPVERKSRMRRMRRNIREQNIFWWVDSFLRSALNKNLGDFPVIEDGVAKIELE